ncbi:MAG: acetylxylan esterase, partial [Planctomycetes bacterium]|nr:acetylxylan esterase [Planctomycetota bacterium]
MNLRARTSCLLVFAALAALASARVASGEEAAPPPGEAMVRTFLEEEALALSARCLEGIRDLETWEARRGELRRELKEMLGLEPEPPRESLRIAVTRTIDREDLGIVVENLHFESIRGLYVTANLYRPRSFSGRLPAVLYLCGHGQVKAGGVSYGNKAYYQHHPAWFARNGYVCLIIDTLQLGEIEGHHHGTYRLGMWWWVARGYTPAGIEAWNSIRALDLLATRPEVDPERIGVTGRSGGGIGSWWLAALDDRVAAAVPVAGITDLRNHVIDGCIEGHCDCNYPVNLYRWDYPALAALAAPRPLLFSNSDKDGIFPLDGVLRVHERVRSIYALHGARDRLGLLITEGPHGDTQDLRVPAFRWMARWLKDEKDAVVRYPAEKLFEPADLKVLDEIPADQINTRVHEVFVPAAEEPEVPASLADFDALRSRLVLALRARTFRNEPSVHPPAGAQGVEVGAADRRDGLRIRRCSVWSERSVRLP